MGNMSGSYGSHYTLWLDVKTNSQNIAENYSNVTVNLYLQFDGSSYYAYTNNATSGNIVVDGLNNGYSISSINFSSGVKKDLLLASWTGNVGHNSDGTKSLTVSGSWNTNTSRIGSGSVSTTINLTKINRYAKFTEFYISGKTVNSISYAWNTDAACDANQYSLNGGAWQNGNWPYFTINGLSPNTKYSLKIRSKRTDSQLWTESSTIDVTTYAIAKMTAAPDVDLGHSMYITFNNPSGTTIKYFLEALYWDNSEHKITVRDVTDVTGKNNATITLTTNELNKIYNLIPHLNQCILRYGIRTFCNGKTYDHFIDKTGYVVNSNPIFNNFTYEDTDEYIVWLTGNNQTILKGYSNIKATISSANKAIAQNGATMKTYKLDIGSESAEDSYSSNSDVSLQTYNVLSNVIQVRATDSRGNTTKVEKIVANYKEYFPINIISMSATRENNVGETVILNFKAKFWNQSFGSVANTIKSCIYKYKKSSESAYKDGTTTLTYTINGNELIGTLVIEGDTVNKGFNISETYNIQLYIKDELSDKTFTITLGSGNPAIAIYKNRVAIGQKYDESRNDAIQVNGKAKFTSPNNHEFLVGEDSIYWKENGYGDKFKMIAEFSGADDDNKMKIMAAVGGAGADPELYDVFRISGKNGNAWIKGNLSIGAMAKNTTATWIPVFKDGRLDYTERKFGGSKQPTNYPTNGDFLATLDFLSWWNGAYAAGGASNLTYCHQGIIQAKPDALYGNADGTTGSVTLSNSCANYDLIEIIFGKGYKYFNCARCTAVDNRIVSLVSAVHLNDTDKQILFRNVLFSGTSITTVGQGVTNFGSTTCQSWNSNEIKIFKVLGYKISP